MLGGDSYAGLTVQMHLVIPEAEPLKIVDFERNGECNYAYLLCLSECSVRVKIVKLFMERRVLFCERCKSAESHIQGIAVIHFAKVFNCELTAHSRHFLI
jgi:hypothetical protein